MASSRTRRSDRMDDLDLDVDAAFTAYTDRFKKRYGERDAGAFVKFGRHMVQKLDREEFEPRLRRYLEMHGACKKMLASGATISDVVVSSSRRRRRRSSCSRRTC